MKIGINYMRLTKASMNKLKPGQAIWEHGIKFQRLENGLGHFSINIMLGRQRVSRVIGTCREGITLKTVEAKIIQYKSEFMEGTLNLPKGRKIIYSFEEASALYLKRIKAGSGEGLKAKQSKHRHCLVPHFGKKPLSAISSLDIQRFKRSRKDNGIGEKTINKDLDHLRHFFNMALEWGWIQFLPVKINALKYKATPGRSEYFTTDQIIELLKSAKKDTSPLIYPFIKIGLDTGMRRTEILSIRIADIDLRKRIISIPKAKAGKRNQPITKRLADFLASMIKKVSPDQEFLFPSNKTKSGHASTIEIPFRRVVEAIGLNPKKYVRHTLRHSAITHLVQSGIDLPTIQLVSGHSNIAMVAEYAHQNPLHIRKAMDSLEANTPHNEVQSGLSIPIAINK